MDKLKEISTVPTVSELFEKIFQYAERQDTAATDPAWDFSNKAGVGLAKSALKSLILPFLPKALQDDAKGEFQLVAANIARPQAASWESLHSAFGSAPLRQRVTVAPFQ